MGIFSAVTGRLIRDAANTDNKRVKVSYGVLAGWLGVVVTLALFVLKMTLGIAAGSVSVIANAFHLLSHLANSVILIVTFKVTARPATAKNPFGHGRMEHIAPLVMSIFLFISGIQIGEHSLHQALHPVPVKYWSALPWILLASIIVKQLLSRYVTYLGKTVQSHAILANAQHLSVESFMSLTVIAGLYAGHFCGIHQADGYIGLLVSAWLLYLGYRHARKAVVPLLGKAPDKLMIEKIRTEAKDVDGISDVHEIIVHDYGSLYHISLHAEIDVQHGPAEMHEIAERCERRLRKIFGGEAVCHTDPLPVLTPELKKVEETFRAIVGQYPEIIRYHDFRIISESESRIIVVADLDMGDSVAEKQEQNVATELEKAVMAGIPDVAYCGFYVTPKFAY